MRAYYATYVYYYTYDITWYAWYGWIWTTLESHLAVICASAPALKGFFSRYFSPSTTHSGTYDYASKQSSSGRKPGYGKMSPGNSLSTSHVEAGGWESESVPMGHIKVSTITNIVDDKDETASQGSNSSTRKLTMIPPILLSPAHHTDARDSSPSIWDGNRTVITAYRQDRELDVEKYTR